jgi:hypothetical protein
MMAICFPAFSASSRIRLMRVVWSFQSPWEKFSLAASIPAWMSLAMIAGELDEGPMVAMIFVRLGILKTFRDSEVRSQKSEFRSQES